MGYTLTAAQPEINSLTLVCSETLHEGQDISFAIELNLTSSDTVVNAAKVKHMLAIITYNHRV